MSIENFSQLGDFFILRFKYAMKRSFCNYIITIKNEMKIMLNISLDMFGIKSLIDF